MFFFPRDIEFARVTAGCQYNCVGLYIIAVGKLYAVEIKTGLKVHNLLRDDFQPVGFGMLRKLYGQFATADVFITRPVFHRIGIIHLAPGQTHLYQNRL